MENDINMYLLLSGGTKLIINKIILAILLGFGNAMIMYTVDPPLYASATYKPKVACCSAKLNGEEKLVISLMLRLFH